MKIVSFGDSFIFGSELKNNNCGTKAWPGLAAKKLGYTYETLSESNCGNESIAIQIMHYFANNKAKDTLAVINWTWLHRWDFYVVPAEEWITVGEACMPWKLERVIELTKAQEVLQFYNKYANSSLLWNKFRSLQTIANIQQYIKEKNINAIQTYTDRHMLDKEFHAPDYIKELQHMISPYMNDWEGKTFLEWCSDKQFEITEMLHPIEQAHQAAADFWIPVYKQRLENAKD